MSESTSDNKLILKNVYELLDETFFIPAYQRGYRWTSIQVKELLDDIWEFCEKKDCDDSTFYCLQPIVVVREKCQWQVVDGQQRLTTLYLILHHLEQGHLRRPLKDAYMKSCYTIEYETREYCKEFLERIHTLSITEEIHNIDFFHMAKAYEAVVEWFKERDYNDINELLRILLAKPSKTQIEMDSYVNNEVRGKLLTERPESRSVKVIWYDLSDECINNDYVVDIFSRINIGKIPLTNAELIRALFLKQGLFYEKEIKLRQIQIASEWDAIEIRLQDKEFWHFIFRSDKNKDYPTRIEYIFDLMKEKKAEYENYYTFHKFSADFKVVNANVGLLWEEIKNYFLTFDEWFRDRELYHLIGFLVDCGHDIDIIKTEAKKKDVTKLLFKDYLKIAIRTEVNCKLSDIIHLSYGDSRIKKILLLLNIQTLLASKESDARFPFDRYKKEKWDIEHIRSKTDIFLKGTNRNDWLKDVGEYFESSSLKNTKNDKGFIIEKEILNEIRKLQSQQKIEDETFNNLSHSVSKYFEESESADWVDGLGNLTLLDAATNRSYKNALFPIKRARIIQNDMQGIFIPICTKNTFLKFYSNSPNEILHWRLCDAEDYITAIKLVLKDFLLTDLLQLEGEVNGQY